MNHRVRASTGITSIALVLLLAGCSGMSDSATTSAPTPPTSTAPVESAAPAATTAPSEPPAPTDAPAPSEPVSEIEAAVQDVMAALDRLGIEHSDPVRADVGGSGAKARFDLTVNGFDAGINIFADEQGRAAWSEMSDAYGGIHVAYGSTALSLNSSEGIANSAEVAPQIAEEIGGKAHGV